MLIAMAIFLSIPLLFFTAGFYIGSTHTRKNFGK
jgi:hypothetical protein